jgi:hypothetical protein
MQWLLMVVEHNTTQASSPVMAPKLSVMMLKKNFGLQAQTPEVAYIRSLHCLQYAK